MTTKKIFKLKGKVQHYAWGGTSFIPKLLNQLNEIEKPWAEYWMGTHKNAPSTIEADEISFELTHFIQQYPEQALGKRVVQAFGELPYLFKVLDVHEMLSIQVHPTKEEAKKGFQKEEAAGIPLDASHRNYKDANHKPEVMVALSDFWLLHGFKTPERIESTLQNEPALQKFLPLHKQEGLRALYALLMEMPQADVDLILAPIVKTALGKKKANQLDKNMPEWWVARLYEHQPLAAHMDRGLFSIYLFNIVHLRTGEGIFQAAGVPHAYLEGKNMELMANSDNVLRAGLTPKHIDVPELMKHTLFEGIVPNILKGRVLGNECFYDCPVSDFGMSAITLEKGQVYHGQTTSFEILFVAQGAIIVKGMEHLIFKQGEAMAILADTNYTLVATGYTEIFRAFVP